MQECPYCKSKRVRKNGMNRGTQRMQCADCKKTFPLNPKRFSKEDKYKALMMYLNNVGIRKIALFFGVSAPAVLKWMENLEPHIGHSFVDKANRTVYYKDGSSLSITHPGDCQDLVYDVNGKKKPNKRSVDKFYFLFCFKDSLRNSWCGSSNIFFCSYGAGYHSKTLQRASILARCKSNYAYCTRLLELDGWEFKKDYPYMIK